MVTVRNAGAADKKFKMMEEEFSMDTFKGVRETIQTEITDSFSTCFGSTIYQPIQVSSLDEDL